VHSQETASAHVLVIHSYNAGNAWDDAVSRGLQDTLSKDHRSVKISMEFMDTRRVTDAGLATKIRELVLEKVRIDKPDLVICADNAALGFFLDHRGAEFKGIPMVFCGINGFDPAMLNGHKGITGIAEDTSTVETLNLTLSLHPSARKIVALTRTTIAADKDLRDDFVNMIKGVSLRVPVELWEDVPRKDLRARLGALPADTIIVLVGNMADESGRQLEYSESAQYVRGMTSAPLYSLWETYMGGGIVGGKLVSGERQGHLAAQLALGILSGDNPDALPVIRGQEANEYVFDYVQLQRLGLSEGDLPAGARIINRPQTVERLDLRLLAIIAAVVLTLLVLVVLLLTAIVRSRRVEEALRKSQATLTCVLNAIPQAVFWKDTRSALMGCNQVFATDAGLTSPDEAVGRTDDSLSFQGEAKAYEKDDREVIESRQAKQHIIEPVQCADGRRITVDTSKIPLVDDHGKVFGVLGVYEDITERVEAQQKMQRHAEEAQRFNRLAIGREHRIVELKGMVNDLSRQLGCAAPFDLARVQKEDSDEKPPTPPQPVRASDLSELIDLDVMKQLLENLRKTVGVEAAIIGIDGKILTGTGGRRICTDFHRVNKGTLQRCQASDIDMAELLQHGQRFCVHTCANGLADAAAPIVIQGEYVANVFAGQFLLEKPDEQAFLRQAQEFGLDGEEYIKALREVPIISEDRLVTILEFMAHMASLIAATGLERLHGRQTAAEVQDRNAQLQLQHEAAMNLAEDADEARQAAERSREGLRQSEAVLRSILESASGGIVCTRRESLDMVNARFCELTGYSREELIGRDGQFLLADKAEYKRIGQEVQRQATVGKASPFETQLRRKDGKVIDVVLSIVSLGAGDPSAAYVATVLDVTPLKRAQEDKLRLEEQLLQAQKMEAVGRLAGGIAHDFNNLLQVIGGNTHLAARQLPHDSPAHDELKAIGEASERAASLIRQLLAFSRRQLMKPQDLDVNAVIEDVLKMISRVIGEHVEVGFVAGHDLGTICADRSMIEQVVVNLCVNARDAMPEGGKLIIETENVLIDSGYCQAHPEAKPGRYVLLSVTDNGMGMDASTMDRIYEPFFTTKESGRGTGLGLATVYGVVKQHDGMIQVYSEPNRGTTFKVYLPIVQRLASCVGPKVPVPVIGGKETILLAEDNEMVRRLAQQILQSAGYTVVPAVDGEDAVRQYNEHSGKIDLLLLDVVMPGLSGRGALDRIRQTRPDIPVLFSSGYSENVVHTNFVIKQGLQLIQKPYRIEDLLQSVRTALDAVV